ncbi:MAG: RNA polymerase sigma factor [Verrucomicrobiota bacterium]
MTDIDFQHLVDQFYQPLFRFGISLSRNQDDASDLVQQTFSLWAAKGHQLRDKSKVKTWLFTTLYREFIGRQRKIKRYPQEELTEAHYDEVAIESSVVKAIDSKLVLQALSELEEIYRAPISLFYLQQHSYQDIAEILEVPVGTIMSRLSRGKQKLRDAMNKVTSTKANKIISLQQKPKREGYGS